MQVRCPCGVKFEAQRSTAKYHSPACRKAASRSPGRKRDRATKGSGVSDFEVATREELERVGKAGSMLGQQVLIVARRMASGTETGSALATLSKEHSRLMAALGAGGKESDPVDEVGRRREEKRARATAR